MVDSLSPSDAVFVELGCFPLRAAQLKATLGHMEYTKYRFILECAKRAQTHHGTQLAEDGDGEQGLEL